MNKQLPYLFILLGLFVGINSGILAAKEDTNIHLLQQNKLIASRDIQQARRLYEQGKLKEAIPLIKKAINAYEQQGETLKQAHALKNLSLIYLQLGNWQATAANINQAIELTSKIDDQQERTLLLNLCLEIRGQLQLAINQPELALSTWEKSSNLAYQRGDISQYIKSEIKQVQALQEMGMYAQAVEILTEIEPKLAEAPPDLVTAKAWQTIGDLLRKLGKFTEAESALDRGLTIVTQVENPQAQAALLISLGHLAKAKKDFDSAVDFYRQAARVTQDRPLQLQAYLSELNILVNQAPANSPSPLISQIIPIINHLPPSKNLVKQRINLAVNLSQLNQPQDNQLILQQLTSALQQARQIGYQRGEANALGNIGKLYQRERQWSEARELTEKALLIAQEIKAPDLAYQWQWQLGQIMHQQENRKAAIASYSGAVNTLKTLRSDLVAVSSDLEFNFRENVEPVYRELVSILLRPEATPTEIRQARDVIEALQLAELDNFFRAACLDAEPVLIDQLTEQEDTTAAVIYTIVLPDRFEMILKSPQKQLRHYSTPLDNPQKVERLLERLAQSLSQRNSQETVPLAQQVYDWLIRPLEEDLATSKTKTLVFVLDSSLRNVPMSILHDGQQYLVEKYSLALSPGLQLIEPQPIAQQRLRALTAGLTEGRGGFPPLKYVVDELNTVQSQVSESELLLDGDFTSTAFLAKINQLPFPVVHLATHGQFSSQAENTFILTWDDRINVNQLNSLLRKSDPKGENALELLVLSACETLTGDRRAALGLAGVALRAGARSTLATLWRVNDEATALLMGKFYQELANQNTDSTKAEALRRAQLALLEDARFRRPHFWAPYVLVGNWL